MRAPCPPTWSIRGLHPVFDQADNSLTRMYVAPAAGLRKPWQSQTNRNGPYAYMPDVA